LRHWCVRERESRFCSPAAFVCYSL
jgi:hypothetical protein